MQDAFGATAGQRATVRETARSAGICPGTLTNGGNISVAADTYIIGNTGRFCNRRSASGIQVCQIMQDQGG